MTGRATAQCRRFGVYNIRVKPILATFSKYGKLGRLKSCMGAIGSGPLFASVRSILPFDNICLSIRRDSNAIQAAYSAGQSCRSDAHRRCRTLHPEAKCTNNPMCLLCITSFPTTPLVITSPSSCHGYLVTEHAMAKPCSGVLNKFYILCYRFSGSIN